MSKEEMKSTVEYKHLRWNFWLLVILAVAWLVIFVVFSAWDLLLGDVTEVSRNIFWSIVAFIAVFLLIFIGPFAVYYGVRLVKIIKNREKYELRKATVSSSEQSVWKSEHKLLCTAVLENSDKAVDFVVYMRAYEHGIELNCGAVVFLWYCEENNSTIFMSK